jgi:hypothetical protein
MRRLLLPLLASALLPGCIAVSVEGVDNWQGSSALWVVYTFGGARTHELMLTSVPGACGKLQKAQQDASVATAAWRERGETVCGSLDTFYDDLADAYRPIMNSGVSTLRVTLHRDGEVDLDASTVPGEGTFSGVGASELTYGGSLTQYSGQPYRARADAFSCEDPDSSDITALLGSEAAEAFSDQFETWSLDAGAVVVADGGDDAWDVEVDADLHSGSNSIGSLQTSFRAKRCEVELAQEP